LPLGVSPSLLLASQASSSLLASRVSAYVRKEKKRENDRARQGVKEKQRKPAEARHSLTVFSSKAQQTVDSLKAMLPDLNGHTSMIERAPSPDITNAHVSKGQREPEREGSEGRERSEPREEKRRE
jgi:hypothetical protein